MDIEIVVGPGGKTTIEINGVVGPSCKSITEQVVEGMGGEIDDEEEKAALYAGVEEQEQW